MIPAAQMVKKMTNYRKELERAKRKSVAVGLPKEKVGGEIYGDGTSVIDVGAVHEYGTADVPRRSFLRVPFLINKKKIDRDIEKAFKLVAESGYSADRALGLIGTQAVNISKGAFTTKGYGAWPDIQQSTKDAKGSSQVLIDTGTLRSSITYVVR